jgi:hypothetical protein
MIHYVNMAKAGFRLNYDDFSMQELRDMEYIYLKGKQKEKENFFEILFKGFGKMFKNILKSFK